MSTTLYFNDGMSLPEITGGDPIYAACNGEKYLSLHNGGSYSSVWGNKSLVTTRTGQAPPGLSLVAQTYAGPEAGHEWDSYLTPYLWISAPLAADVTISGSITFNLCSYESSMSANVGINCRVLRWRGADGYLIPVHKTVQTTEMGTAETALNWSETPLSSEDFVKGDRIMLVPIFTDAGGTAGNGYQAYFVYFGQAGQSGDSYVTFTENFSFETGASGTVVYPVNDVVTDLVSSLNYDRFQDVDHAPYAAHWSSEQWSGYTNAAGLVREAADGYPASDGCMKATFTGANDQGFLKRVRVPYASNAYFAYEFLPSHQYTLKFRAKMVSGSGPLQWGIGSYATGGASRGVSGSQTITGSWVEYTFNWTPSTRILDPCIWFCSYGAITAVVLFDLVSLTAAATFKEAWTSRGVSATSVVTTAYGSGGWVCPQQLTGSAGGQRVEWYTRPLAACTLSGPVYVHPRCKSSALNGNAGLRCTIDLVDSSGNLVSNWATSQMGVLNTTEYPYDFYVQGPNLAISDGQRLRITFYVDDGSGGDNNGGGSLVNGTTATLYFSGTTGGASGDTYLQFPITLAEQGQGGAGSARHMIGSAL